LRNPGVYISDERSRREASVSDGHSKVPPYLAVQLAGQYLEIAVWTPLFTPSSDEKWKFEFESFKELHDTMTAANRLN
jgi:hypothetical protein